MEKLKPTQVDAVKKMSTARLGANLLNAGFGEEEIDAMDRQKLMNTWAECMAAGKEKAPPAQQAGAAPGYDVELERRKLDFEIRRFEAQEKARVAQEQTRREELEAQEKVRQEEQKLKQEESSRQDKLRREDQERHEKLKFEDWERQEKLKRLELDALERMKEAEWEQQRKMQEAKRAERQTDVEMAKRYGDAIKNSMSPMGPDALEMIAFFKHIENVYDRFKVPTDLRADLLQPYLNLKSRTIVGRMEAIDARDYEKIRDVILREHKLTPATYLEYFNTIACADDETCVMFGTRLKSLLDQYVESRGVKEGDFGGMKSLILCDRIKSTLPDGILRHILSIESGKKEGWLRAHELAEAVDVYTANHNANDKPRASAVGSYCVRNGRGENARGGGAIRPQPVQRPSYQGNRGGGNGTGNFRPPTTGGYGQSNTRTGPKSGCYHCHDPSHYRNKCPLLRQTGGGRVNTCSVVGPPSSRTSNPGGPTTAATAIENTTSKQVNSSDTVGIQTPASIVVNECIAVHSQVHDLDFKGNITTDIDNVANVLHCESYRDFASLQFIDVCIEEINSVHCIKALEDSGAELCVIKQDIVKAYNLPTVGSVQIRGIVGAPVDAQLVKLHVSVANSAECVTSVPIVCAVCPSLNESMIITLPVAKQLRSAYAIRNVDSTVVDDQRGSGSDGGGDRQQAPPLPTDSEGAGGELPDDARVADADVLRAEQLTDATLKPGWTMAERGKGGFFIRDGLLYHSEKVESIGERCTQLCVPAGRRNCVLKLAHSTNHESYRRTRDRIRLSFFWPLMLKEAKKFCRECEPCQKHARVTVWDRVPITAVPRAQHAFQVFYADCAGPLFPNQSTNAYNYFFAMCDSATSFPFAYPLRSLSAKNICEAMIKTFTITGVPEVVILDNASYNRSKLLGETMRQMGCEVRFSTPYHPQGHAAAERLIGSLKNMVAKVAAEKPKQWHLHLDFILWALRESKNESLGVAPWTLVFSRLPRGPLSILKETWEGARDPPFSLGKNADEILQELNSKFETVRKFAEPHNAVAQHKYTSRYNLRARDKHFSVGDQVLMLTPDSTASRTFSRWKGPAQVVEIRSPHSYVVELDGVRHHVHANRIKQFVVAINYISYCPDFETVVAYDTSSEVNSVDSCAVITDLDCDFGDIYCFHTVEDKAQAMLPSQKIDRAQIEHLTPPEQQELLKLLDKYPECFSDDPGLCDLAVHEINLTPDFRPKRLRAYRVPEKLKEKVSDEIQRMLTLGIIRPSTSEMVSPLVVVLKGKDGKDGLRLAVDYSYINKFTRNDPFPVPDIDTIIQRVGGASLISTFDASAGYHQTKVRAGDEPLTAFVCDDGVFEFTRTPFGGKACGATFLRAVQLALKPLKSSADAYVDDMIVHTHGQGFKRHLGDLENFLQRIREVHMTLKLRKCRFALREVKFCGKIIGSGTKRPDPAKVAAVQGLKAANTKTEVRQLLGLFSYFREHIPNFAAIARPLTDLTSKRVPNPLPWTEEHTVALDQLKHALCKATTLYIADFQRPFNVTVDASDYAVAGYLSQIDGEGIERPLAFFSAKLTGTQKAWATVHKEAYAVISALKKFRTWIFGAEINVFSDHNPLSFLTETAPKNAKLMRWALALQEFDIKFHFLRGKLNTVSDCLSRLGPGEP